MRGGDGENHLNVRQDSSWHGRDSIREQPKYMSEALELEAT